MTEPEALTAKQRAYFDGPPPHWGRDERELLRLYDAALANQVSPAMRAEFEIGTEQRYKLRVQLDAALAESRDLIAQRDTALGLCKQREGQLEACEKHLSIVIADRDGLGRDIGELAAHNVQLMGQAKALREERDAALARAEAAESKCAKLDNEWHHQRTGRVAAESALAEATALLATAANVVKWQGWHDDYKALLSRTPAPAAKAEPVVAMVSLHNRYDAALNEIQSAVEGITACMPSGAADAAIAVIEECRSGLHQNQADSARAERDTARAECDRLEAILILIDSDLINSRALVERIEAELLKVMAFLPKHLVHNGVLSALDIIRAAKEGA